MKSKNIYKALLAISSIFILINSVYSQVNKKQWSWVNTINSKADCNASDIVVNEKNVFIGGTFSDSIEISNNCFVAKGNKDIYIARFSLDGGGDWAVQLGGIGNDIVTNLATSPNSNDVYLSGEISSELNNRKINGAKNNLIVAKANQNGKVKWVEEISFSKNAKGLFLKTNAKGEIYFSGVFNGTLSVDGKLLQSAGLNDIFLLKFNKKGKLINYNSFGGKANEIITSLNVDDQILLCATFDRDTKFNNVTLKSTSASNSILCKIDDKNYENIWWKKISSISYFNINSIEYAKNSSYYLAGTFKNNIKIEDLEVVNDGYSEGFLMRINCDSNWIKPIGNKLDVSISGLKINGMNHPTIVGSFKDSIKLGNKIFYGKDKNAFIAVYNNKGDCVWSDIIESNNDLFVSKAAIDNSGNVYTVGGYTKEFNLNSYQIQNSSSEDIWFAKCSNCTEIDSLITISRRLCENCEGELTIPNGFLNVVWNDTIYGSNSLVINKEGIYTVSALSQNGCIYYDTINISKAKSLEFSLGKDTVISVYNTMLLTGPEIAKDYLWSSGSINSSINAQAVNFQEGACEYELLVTDANGCTSNDKIKILFYDPMKIDINHLDKSSLNIYPNPIEDIINVFSLNPIEQKINYQLLNVNGKILLSGEILTNGSSLQSIDASNLLTGNYVLKLNVGDEVITKNIVKN